MNIAFDLTIFFMTAGMYLCLFARERVQQMSDSNNENMFHIKIRHKF